MAEPDDELPRYEPMLAAYHEAFATELARMVADLPLKQGAVVLDLACGDGFYTRELARRVGPEGRVVAVDILPAYLAEARATTEGDRCAGPSRFVAASVEQLPFGEGTFDLAWCAQSLFSLDDPAASLRAMARVVRPGGIVAVLEDDSLHRIILPWPIEVELSVKTAELAAFIDESDRPRKYYVGRRLRQVFEKAGLVDVRVRTWATDRLAPLGDAETTFLRSYLGELAKRVTPRLERERREEFRRLVEDPADGMLAWPDLTVTVLDHVVWGVRP